MMRILPLLLALLVVASPANAGPIAAAVSAIGSMFTTGVFASGTILGFLARTVLSIGLSLLQQALRGKPDKPRKPGIQTDFTTTGGTEPQSFILGRYATAGHLVYVNTHGSSGGDTPNRWLTYVIELCDIPGVSLNRLIVDGEYRAIDFDTTTEYGHPVTGLENPRNGNAIGWVQFYDGTQTVADPMLVDKYGTDPHRPWLDTAVGTDTAYAIVTFKLGRALYKVRPACRFELDGIPLYDPRQDGSVGGTGTHRWNDQSTWEQTDNPIVMVYNLARGIPLPDGNIYGADVAAGNLPLSNWIAGMNACDETVGDNARPRYRAGFEVRIGPRDMGGDEPAEIVEELLKACAGQITETGGVFRVRVGPPAAPVLSITDEDIVVTDAQQFAPFPGLEATFNGVTFTHPSPNALWEGREGTPIYNATWEAEDGNRRLVASLQLPAVPYAPQARQLARALINDERRFRQHRIVLPPEYAALEGLDALSWTSVWNSYTGKTFEVIGGEYRPGSEVIAIDIRERDSGDFDYDAVFDEVEPDQDTETDLPLATTLTAFSATAITISDGAGNPRRPAIELTWADGADLADTDVDAIQFRVREKVSGTIIYRDSTTDVVSERFVVHDVLASEIYEAAARPVAAERDTDWTAWIEVTAQDVRLGEADVSDAVRDKLSTMQERADEAEARHEATLEAADDLLAPVRDRLEFEVPQLRSTEDAVDEILEYLAGMSSLQFATAQLVADAGIYVEPSTGQVRIAGMVATETRVSNAEILVDALEAEISLKATEAYVDQAISEALLDPTQIPIIDELELRVSEVEIGLSAAEGDIDLIANTLTVEGEYVTMTSVTGRLDSVEGAITLKVDQSDFNDVETRLSSAEVSIETLDGPSITQTVSDTRAQFDELDEAAFATLGSLLDAYAERQAIREATAFARQQLAARTDSLLEAEASARLELAALVGGNSGTIAQLSMVKVDADGAIAAIDNIVAAEFGDLSTFSQFSRWAIANADGTNAGFRFDLGGEDVLSAVRVDENGDEEPSTTVRLAGTNIRLDGNVDVTGDFMADVIGAREGWIQDLSAATANFGTFRSGEWPNERTVIRSDRIDVFDNNNVLRVRIGNLS